MVGPVRAGGGWGGGGGGKTQLAVFEKADQRILSPRSQPRNCCILLSYAAPYRASMHPFFELSYTLWAKPHPASYTRVSSKWKKKISVQTETNRNKICFAFVSVRFVKPKIFFSVCYGVSNLYRNNRNKQNCFETNRNKPKQSEIFWKIPKYVLYQNLAKQKKFLVKEDDIRKSSKALFTQQIYNHSSTNQKDIIRFCWYLYYVNNKKMIACYCSKFLLQTQPN